MEINYCRRCGLELKKVNNHTFDCNNNHTEFVNPSPTVGVFIIDGENILMSVRGIEPGKGMLDSFGGFLDGEESFEDAVIRELKEETQLTPQDYQPPKYLCSASATYNYKGENKPVVSAFYTTQLKPGANIIPSDDVSEVKIINIKDVDLDQVFNKDVKTAFKKLSEEFGVII